MLMENIKLKLANDFLTLLTEYELGNHIKYDKLIQNMYVLNLKNIKDQYIEFIKYSNSF